MFDSLTGEGTGWGAASTFLAAGELCALTKIRVNSPGAAVSDAELAGSAGGGAVVFELLVEEGPGVLTAWNMRVNSPGPDAADGGSGAEA